MIVNADWPNLKVFVDENALTVDWVMVDDVYFITARRVNMEVTARISITDPPNADQTDFEDNYK